MRILPALFTTALLATATAANAGNTFSTDKNPMTNLVGGTVWINSTGNLSLIVSCDDRPQNHSIELAIFSKDLLGEGSARYREAAFRFDGAKPVQMIGRYGDHVVSLGIPATPSSNGGQIIRLLRASKHAVMQVTDFQGVTVTEEFDLGDARALIDKTIVTCKDTDWISATK